MAMLALSFALLFAAALLVGVGVAAKVQSRALGRWGLRANANARAVFAEVARRAHGEFDPGSDDVSPGRSPRVRFFAGGVWVELTVVHEQGASKLERRVLPVAWVVSPSGSPFKSAPLRSGELRVHRNRFARLEEHVFDAESLIRIAKANATGFTLFDPQSSRRPEALVALGERA